MYDDKDSYDWFPLGQQSFYSCFYGSKCTKFGNFSFFLTRIRHRARVTWSPGVTPTAAVIQTARQRCEPTLPASKVHPEEYQIEIEDTVITMYCIVAFFKSTSPHPKVILQANAFSLKTKRPNFKFFSN
jgi:hypothetical protein